ncbi:MAG: hypothetical protein R3C01_02750 [Planctomycetaceae bacterium]
MKVDFCQPIHLLLCKSTARRRRRIPCGDQNADEPASLCYTLLSKAMPLPPPMPQIERDRLTMRMPRPTFVQTSVAVVTMMLFANWAGASDSWPVIFEENFEGSVSRWRSPDPSAWKVEEVDGNRVFRQFQQSRVFTPVRSPFNRAVVSDLEVGSFQLDVRFRSTARDYPHRSLCLFFGVQDRGHMYYVHFGQKTDDHANQIFVVNDAPRVKISTKTTEGTPWDNAWHRARIVRNVESGEISVYFDDMKTPVMTAIDKTFTTGRIGIGSFDDTGDFDDITLRGPTAARTDR